jgi:hypothetical protein
MKKLLIIFFLLTIGLKTFANQVDNLTTNLEVQDFLLRILNSPKTWDMVRKVTLCDWQKLDVNNDRRSDLLVQASLNDYVYWTHTFVIVDNGNDGYKLCEIGLHEDAYIAKIINDHSQTLIIHNSTDYNYKRNHLARLKKEYKTDTLIYRDGGFVERNKNPAVYVVDSIQFGAFNNWAYQWSPDIEIDIAPSGKAIYTVRRDNIFYTAGTDVSKIYRDFETTIKPDNLKEIYDLINYTAIKTLKDTYAVGATDFSTVSVRIKFRDGSVKYITDYGGQGTFGLKLLYSIFYALRKNQDWK